MKALQGLRNRENFSAYERSQIKNLVTHLDEHSFDLYDATDMKREAGQDEDAEEDKSWTRFRQARAATGLLFAMEADSFLGSTEAIYEATATAKTDVEAQELLDHLKSLILPPQ